MQQQIKWTEQSPFLVPLSYDMSAIKCRDSFSASLTTSQEVLEALMT